MTTPYQNKASDYDEVGGVDLQNIFNAFRRHMVPVILAAGLVLALAAASYLLTTKIYSSTARVGIERQLDDVVAPTGSNQRGQILTTDSSQVDTEVAQITSGETLRRVVQKLNLETNADFAGEAQGRSAGVANAIGTLSRNLSVSREGDSYAIDIKYSSRDPKLAAAIVNATVDAYFDRQRSEKEGSGRREIALLRTRLETLKDDVQRAETSVAQFRAKTDLVDIQNESTAAQQSISVLSQQLATAQAEQAAASARNTAASARSAGAGSSIVSPVLQNLRTEESQLSAQREALANRYGPNHPSLIEIDQQLGETRRQINNEVARVREGLTADARVAQQRTSSIMASMNAQKEQLLQGNAASVRLAELEREANSAKSLYEALMERYRQAIARQGTERSNAYVIARGAEPTIPDSPSLAMYGAGGVICALLAASVVTASLELLERGLSTRRQVERRLGLPVLASVPDLTKVDKHAVSNPSPTSSSAHLIEHPGDLYSESFRAIRTALRIGRENQQARCVALCSALPGEGKTTTALSLARSAALSGLKVLLVDCDLRRQASSRQVDGIIAHGLIELLQGTATLEQAVTRDSASGAYVLPQKPSAVAEQHYDAIASSQMKQLVEQLKGQFDLVVLDTAPVLAIADSRAVASMADVALVAVRWRKTPVQAVQMALDQLALAEAVVAGVILTMVDVNAQVRAGSGDELKYYKAYSKYYS